MARENRGMVPGLTGSTMNPRLQWAFLIVVALAVIGYTAYLSRIPVVVLMTTQARPALGMTMAGLGTRWVASQTPANLGTRLRRGYQS